MFMKKTESVIKRFFDIVVSLLGLIIASPLFFIVGLLIKITLPGPIFFKQERVGKDKAPFTIFKFRTMKVDKDAESRMDFSKDAERLTGLGSFLRRSKIDELPQLINVLINDMSLVGPRPTIMKQVELYTDYQLLRLKMKPGMTGLAQVNGNTAISWEDRIKYDVKYVEHFSLYLDFKILLKTIAIVIFGEEKYKNATR
jgi:undecaprenyl phosphate N,N'-diacetylbacillosamine 1-phosphate transferase